jgi:hypothetical protein
VLFAAKQTLRAFLTFKENLLTLIFKRDTITHKII